MVRCSGGQVLAFLLLSCTPLLAVLVQTRAELCEAAAANKDPVHWSQCAEGLLNTPITLDNDTMMPSTGHCSLEDTGAGGWPVTSWGWGRRHNVATVLLSKFRRKLLAFSSIR